MIGRRGALALIGGAGLGAPASVAARSARTLRFVPQTDITSYDPVFSSTQVTRNYAYLVYDTLFGLDRDLLPQPQPQMAEGAVEEEGEAALDRPPAPGPRLPRRHAGAGAGLRGEHPALGGARFLRPVPNGRDGRDRDPGRPHPRLPPAAPLPAAALRPSQSTANCAAIMPELEALRTAWFDAPDLAEQQRAARAIQERAFRDVPYVPLGQFFAPVAYRRGLRDMVTGFPVFWNIRRD